MDTNTVRDLTQRSLNSNRIRFSRSVNVISLNLIRLSRSLTPVHEIDTDTVRDSRQLNPNDIRPSRSITPFNEIDTDRVKDLERLNPNGVILYI